MKQSERALAVGIPKSGTHAAYKALRLLHPYQNVGHSHSTDTRLLDTHKVFYIYRNPRDVLVSLARYRNDQVRGMQNQPITPEVLRAGFFEYFNSRLDTVYFAHREWLDSEAFISSYENLIADDKVMRRLADYLEVPYNGQFDRLDSEEDSPTWHKTKSCWQDYWNNELNDMWHKYGMHLTEERLGYYNDTYFDWQEID